MVRPGRGVRVCGRSTRLSSHSSSATKTVQDLFGVAGCLKNEGRQTGAAAREGKGGLIFIIIVFLTRSLQFHFSPPPFSPSTPSPLPYPWHIGTPSDTANCRSCHAPHSSVAVHSCLSARNKGRLQSYILSSSLGCC